MLIKAMACECPAVASDHPGGVREVLDGVRRVGLVPAGDPEGIAGAMLEAPDARPDPEPLRRRAMDFHIDRATEPYREVLGA